MITFTATESEHNSRLDRLLRKRLPLLGLSSIYGLVRKGNVRINGKRTKQDYRLQEGDEVSINVNESEYEPQSVPESGLANLARTDFFKRNFHILHEDENIIVCDKPAGLVVHSGSGHSSHDNLIDLATAYMMSKETRGKIVEAPVLMHRLDRDTSGVILLAKNKGVVRTLHADLRDGKFVKQYIAVCHNRPPEFEGTITVGMSRKSSSKSGMKMGVDKDGASSSTTYKIAEYHNNLSKIELQLHSGKTHQIRVHLTHIGAPIVGDVRYGNAKLDNIFFDGRPNAVKRLYLHAHKLSFPHPKTKKNMTLTSKVPSCFVI